MMAAGKLLGFEERVPCSSAVGFLVFEPLGAIRFVR